MKQSYRIEYTFSSRDDMRNMKKYILENFKYRELGENFTQKMKKATNGLKTLPTGFDTVSNVCHIPDTESQPYQILSVTFLIH